jgi:hypothetical protein
LAPSRFFRSAASALSLAALAIAASARSQSAAPTAPLIGSFAATPSSISLGASTLLSWTVSGASSLSIDHGVGVVTGTSLSVTPAATTTYRLTATSDAGTSTATGQDLVAPRYSQTATVLKSGKVLVAGGIGSRGPLASAEIFTPVP